MKTPLQQLTTLIQQSNPELMTLGVGCEVDFPLSKKQGMSDDGIYTIVAKDLVYRNITFKEGEAVFGFFHLELESNNQITIIGKPPTLVDVLKWLLYELNYSINDTQIQNIILMWTASKSIYLRDQSPELINFLLELKK